MAEITVGACSSGCVTPTEPISLGDVTKQQYTALNTGRQQIKTAYVTKLVYYELYSLR